MPTQAEGVRAHQRQNAAPVLLGMQPAAGVYEAMLANALVGCAGLTVGVRHWQYTKNHAVKPHTGGYSVLKPHTLLLGPISPVWNFIDLRGLRMPSPRLLYT